MRRTLFKLGVFLVPGAVVNVAVAWGCIWSVRYPFSDLRNADIARDADRWHREAPPSFDFTACKEVSIERFGVVCRCMWNLPNRAPEVDCYVFAENVEGGWPLHAFEGTLWRQADLDGIYREPAFRGTLPIELHRNDSPIVVDGMYQVRLNAIPYRPRWPGFAINTLFYTAVCWLLFAAPFLYRRRRRIKRGLCPACGYPTGTSDRCTECGGSVTPKPAGVAA